MPDTEPDPQLVALLASARRGFVPIDRSFVQNRAEGRGAAALADFVAQRRHQALDLYLLAHALASAPPYDVNLSATTWANLLSETATSAARVSVSRNLTWLEQQRLITTRRRNRRREVTVLREDRSGHALGGPAPLDYFKLPHEYWLHGWQRILSMPGLAVLLIALSLPARFQLPRERGPQWYGVSPDTIRRGVRELIGHGLLTYRVEVRRAPRSPLGTTEQRVYVLQEAFAANRRRSQLISAQPPG